jgi:hypothetical protein
MTTSSVAVAEWSSSSAAAAVAAAADVVVGTVDAVAVGVVGIAVVVANAVVSVATAAFADIDVIGETSPGRGFLTTNTPPSASSLEGPVHRFKSPASVPAITG